MIDQTLINNNNRRRRNILRLHELTHQPTTYQPNFNKHFIISSKSGENLAEIDVVAANRELEAHIQGSPKRISELRSGQLLIEVKSEQQSRDIVQVSSLGGIEVKVEPHRTLNQSKGTIYYQNRPNYTDEQLQNFLAPYNVTSIYRTNKKKDGQLTPTPIYIITFNCSKLPENIRIGWTQCSVRQYIPKPRRCFNCQRFGHGSKTCRANEPTCANCGDNDTHDTPCDRATKCANCDGNHPAYSSSCFYYKFEMDVLQLQATEKISYFEAKKTIKHRLPHSGQSYASVVSNSNRQPQHLSTKPMNKPSPNIANTDQTNEPGTSRIDSNNNAISNAKTSNTIMPPPPKARVTKTPLTSNSQPVQPTPSVQTPTTSNASVPNTNNASNSKIPTSRSSSNSRRSSSSSRQTKRPAEEQLERPHSSRRGKSLIKDFPMPENMPTHYPPPSNNINVIQWTNPT